MEEIIEVSVGTLHLLARDQVNRSSMKQLNCIPFFVQVREGGKEGGKEGERERERERGREGRSVLSHQGIYIYYCIAEISDTGQASEILTSENFTPISACWFTEAIELSEKHLYSSRKRLEWDWEKRLG